MARLRLAMAALSPQQKAIIAAVSFVSIIATAALIWYFNKRNARA